MLIIIIWYSARAVFELGAHPPALPENPPLDEKRMLGIFVQFAGEVEYLESDIN